ncbi:MAG: hypothetical protein H6Q26_56 [Bacteroidetes bacterium]|nr:hypothetical protein [Bacteroidota bacterium]
MSKNRLSLAIFKSIEGLKYYVFSPTGNKKTPAVAGVFYLKLSLLISCFPEEQAWSWI